MFEPILAPARYVLGHRALKRHKWNDAIAHLTEAIRLVPHYPVALCNRGLAYQGIGDHRLATLDFDRAIALAPNFGIAYYNRGISAKLMGDFDRSVADHAKAIALNPAHADAHAEQGIAYTCKHEYHLAIAALTRAMKLDPDEPSHPRYRGYAHFYRGDFSASTVDLRHSLDRATDAYAMLFCYLARTKAGDAVESQLLADSARLRSRSWPAQVVDLYLGSCTVEALLKDRVEPNELGEAHFYVGQWHLLRGDREEAVRAFREAMHRCPTVYFEHTGAVVELGRLGCM